jgi:Arc/MetJ family transcription regulator
MGLTNIDIDETACAIVMQRHQLATPEEAVNFSLRAVAGQALNLTEARALRGSGWDGDLDAMRSTRVGQS